MEKVLFILMMTVLPFMLAYRLFIQYVLIPVKDLFYKAF